VCDGMKGKITSVNASPFEESGLELHRAMVTVAATPKRLRLSPYAWSKPPP
jgi:hypothetical protein